MALTEGKVALGNMDVASRIRVMSQPSKHGDDPAADFQARMSA